INGVTRHVIVATDEEIEKELDRIRKRFGDVSHPEQTNAESWFTAEFAEFDADDKLKPEGKADMVTIYMNALRKKETVEKLTGLKPVDFMILDLKEDFEDENEYRHTFSLGKENLEDFGPKVRITVHEISEIIPAELNEELFVEAFDEKVTTLDEAKVEIRRSIENQYKADSDRVFFNDVIGKIMENPNVEFSTGFLKRWLVATHENPMNEDELQKEADSTVNPLKWHLIRKKIINGNDLEVTENEIKKYAEIMLVRTMLQYRQMIPEKKELEGMVDRLLQKDKQRDEIFEKLMEFKMIDLFIKKVPAEILEMSFAEFLDKMNSRAREHIHDENCDHDHDHSH
ncbi:MAG: hypothetical protein KKA07_03060, partial [Bacteroidetes bacterium]|nr:hypothetical protein [Bacteroidota bacterium]